MARQIRDLKAQQKAVETSPPQRPQGLKHSDVRVLASATEALEATEVRGSTPAQSVLGLQRHAGNRATATLLAAGQAKLVVGAAGDRYEQEADTVAAQVLARLRSGASGPAEAGPMDLAGAGNDRSEDEPLARKLSAVARRPLRRTRTVTDSQEEAEPMGAAGGELDGATEASIEAARRGGSPMPQGVRRQMEGAFGADFSPVKLHKGEKAEDLNHRVGALAFTVGSDIFLGRSAPAVSSPAGQELVAHELAHVVQQGGARLRPEGSQ